MMMIRASVALAVIAGSLVAFIGVDAAMPESKTLLRSQERALNSPTAKVTALELINTLTHTAVMSLVNGTIVDIATIAGMTAPSFSIVAQVEGTGIKSVGFQLDKLHVEKIAPYALCANRGNVFNTCPQLMLGTHTLSAAAYPCLHARCPPTAPPMTITFTIINSQLTTPPSAPTVAAAAPVAAPIVAPTTEAPVTHAPVTQAPVTQAPVTQAPATQAPVTQVPATQAPVTQAPVTRWSECDTKTTALTYIQCIALGDRVPTLTGSTPEDQALQWLVQKESTPLMADDDWRMTPDGNWRRHLRQQYALLTLGFQPTTNGANFATAMGWSHESKSQECGWDHSITCGFLDWMTGYWRRPDAVPLNGGTFPADFGLLHRVQRLEMSHLNFTGTLPSTIGLLTGIEIFHVDNNRLAGTIPSSISSWRYVLEAKFENNDFNGTMPTFQSGFCPKTAGSSIPMKVLSADCSAEGPGVGTTKPEEITCACCGQCY